MTPSETLVAPQPLNIVFPLGNGGVLRSEEGGGFRKEGDGGEGEKRRKKRTRKKCSDFGKPLGGSQASQGFWKLRGLSRGAPHFPATSLTEALRAIDRFPESFPDFPGSSPDLPRAQPLSLGSLTPSDDSQKVPLTSSEELEATEILISISLRLSDSLRLSTYNAAPKNSQ